MIFNSVSYILFLAIIVPFYWLLPRTPRLYLVFSASLVFYGFWRPEFVFLLLFSTLIDYSVALGMEKSDHSEQRKRLLLVSLVANLGLLFYFKYLFFFLDNMQVMFNLFGTSYTSPSFNIILPLGISFYTFQTISYSVDVYRRFIKPEKNFILYGCYVTFFPQLIAGPILRAGEVIYPLKEKPLLDVDHFKIGLKRILYGLFLKVGLADNLAPLVDAGFAEKAASLSALDVWTLAFLFGFQIYFDFAAYSHIALGSARLIGLQFPENFNFPYSSSSPREFWRRWHISLSSWIRDYLYFPLAGIAVEDRSLGGLGKAMDQQSKPTGGGGQPKLVFSLFLTWAIMGLWHGAAWTFVLWGIYHAVLVFSYRLSQPFFSTFSLRVRTLGGLALTLPLVMLSWIPFRAASISDTLTMFVTLANPAKYTFLSFRETTYLIATLVLIMVLLSNLIYTRVIPKLKQYPVVFFVFEVPVLGLMVMGSYIYLRPISQFIYFQF